MGEIESLKRSLMTSQTLNEGYKKSRRELDEKVGMLETELEKARKRVEMMKKQEQATQHLL